jgi:hypothetical protein
MRASRLSAPVTGWSTRPTRSVASALAHLRQFEVTDDKIARCAQCGMTWCVDPVGNTKTPLPFSAQKRHAARARAGRSAERWAAHTSQCSSAPELLQSCSRAAPELQRLLVCVQRAGKSAGRANHLVLGRANKVYAPPVQDDLRGATYAERGAAAAAAAAAAALAEQEQQQQQQQQQQPHLLRKSSSRSNSSNSTSSSRQSTNTSRLQDQRVRACAGATIRRVKVTSRSAPRTERRGAQVASSVHTLNRSAVTCYTAARL